MEVDEDEPMEVDVKHKKKDRKDKEKPIKPQKSSLLSFGDEGIFHNNIRGLGWLNDTTCLFTQVPTALLWLDYLTAYFQQRHKKMFDFLNNFSSHPTFFRRRRRNVSSEKVIV